jgi:hypothetical protein
MSSLHPALAASGFFGMTLNAVEWARVILFAVLGLIVLAGLIGALWQRSLPKIMAVILMGALSLTVAYNLLQLRDIGGGTIEELRKAPPPGSSNIIGQ